MLEKEIYGKVYLEPEVADLLAAKDLGTDHVINDWPWGRKQKCSMHFYVESNKRGQRFCKQSTFDGRTNKAKCNTYTSRVRLVEIDGRMGHVSWHKAYGHFGVDIEDGRYASKTFFDEDGQTLANHFFGKEG